MTQYTVTEMVSRGMTLLTDEQIDKIDLELLDIASPTRCILGQLFGSFVSDESYWFQEANGLTGFKRVDGGTVVDHGFDTWVFSGEHYNPQDLTDEWVRQITAHREARVSA
jgi:hypothetical protein